MDDLNKQLLTRIFPDLKEGKVVLFIGAGATLEAGGLDTEQLKDMVRKNFPLADQKCDSHFDLFESVIEEYGREPLEDFIRSKFDTLRPTDAHYEMIGYNWAAIFTTNYDDLIEESYRCSKRLKPLKPIVHENFSEWLADRSKVRLFKMMGCMRADSNDIGGRMVLSQSDYIRALGRRRKYSEYLYDALKGGTVIFIGYSFNDNIVMDIIQGLIDTYGVDNIPRSYVLFPDHGMSQRRHERFLKKKIQIIGCTFGEFFEFLRDSLDIESIPSMERSPVRLIINGKELSIERSDYDMYKEFFNMLSEDTIKQDPGDQDDFFRDINKSWGAFRKEWDFKRDIYYEKGGILDKVTNELEEYRSHENKVFLILGMPGIGKTILLRRLAFDIYSNGIAPVIYIDSFRAGMDFKLIDGFIEKVNRLYDKSLEEGEKSPPIKPLILIDDAASWTRYLYILKNWLASRGKQALIVAAERPGEWNLASAYSLINVPSESTIYISETLNESEKKRIVNHLFNLGYIRALDIEWDQLISKEYEKSFFATIYKLVIYSQKSLNEIIEQQYRSLTPLTKEAFEYVCCFHQFNLPMNIELLVRSLGCGYPDFTDLFDSKDASSVLYDDIDPNGNILYRTHHRIIAERVAKNLIRSPKEILVRILRHMRFHNHIEKELCEKLLISFIGPNGVYKDLYSYEEKREMFEAACSDSPTRAILHHWGILEMDNGNFSQSEKLLLRVLREEKRISFYRTESEQNIRTTLGNLYSRMGELALKSGMKEEADRLYGLAEIEFLSSRHGEFPNKNSYHAHARMYKIKGDNSSTDEEKLKYYSTALGIIDLAHDNLNEEDLKMIVELKLEIFAGLGKDEEIRTCTDYLRNYYNSPAGYLLQCYMLSEKAIKEGEFYLFQDALRIAEEGLGFFPRDESLLRLRCKLLRKICPDDHENYYEALLEWKRCSEAPNIKLLFELGATSFLLEEYQKSEEFFTELQKSNAGIKERTRPQRFIRDENRNKRIFEGSVARLYNPYNGEIRVDSLRNLRYNIDFRPIACRFEARKGDQVSFKIAFNNRGPLAIDVKKI